MYGRKQALAGAVVKHRAQQFKAFVGGIQTVAMSQEEHLSANFHNLFVLMHRHAAFLFEVVALPKVVVAVKVVHLDAHVGEFADFAKQARIALRHHRAVFVPEVEHIAQQVHRLRLVFDFVQKTHQTAFLRAGMRNSQAAQMSIRQKVNRSARAVKVAVVVRSSV